MLDVKLQQLDGCRTLVLKMLLVGSEAMDVGASWILDGTVLKERVSFEP